MHDDTLADRVAEKVLAKLTGGSSSDEYLDTAELSELIGLAKVTIEQWRARGDGPAYSKVGRRVVYKRSDVDAWLDEHKRGKR